MVLLSHSNRPVDFSQCSLDALTARYADPDRLAGLPPFETLAPLCTQRHAPAGLSILALTLDRDAGRAELAPLATFDPPGRKVQHACLAGPHLVVCLEDALLVFDHAAIAELPPVLDAKDARHLDDPWFAGLHTVFASGSDRCIVSASAPDAILEVDIAVGQVVERTRLPEALYGHNYPLDAAGDLHRHYVANDLQLAHLNCAYPDTAGGIVVSTLIQGDIGQLDAGGRYRIVSHGSVGCHGARETADGKFVYFTDSCRGALVVIDESGTEVRRHAIDSRWLHDAQQVYDDLFLFCVADHNRLDLIDVATGRTWLSQHFAERGAAVQFVNVAPGEAADARH